MLIETTIEVDSPITNVWQLFGENFADIADWASAISESSLEGQLGEGAVRTCHLKAVGPFPAGVVTEELTTFDRRGYRLTYLVTSGVPAMMKRVENAWTFEDLAGGGTRITSRLEFRLQWWALLMTPVVYSQLKGTMAGFVKQLRRHTEGSRVGVPAAAQA